MLYPDGALRLLASILIAGAIAFCAGVQGQDEPRCSDAPVAPVALTAEHRATLARLANEAYLGMRYAREGGAADEWRARRSGDCEDALLWAARELRASHPDLANAYRFVAVRNNWERAGGARVMHLVLVIEGEGERVVIDTQHRRLRAWSDFQGREVWSARAGMGGAWSPYS
jgi:hypothetical protein